MNKLPDEDWRDVLTVEQYRICREKGTEQPFSGKLLHNKEPGHYSCVCCGNVLFLSDTKFDSGTGWPSFWQDHAPDATLKRQDMNGGIDRTEVICQHCSAHLGHIFTDGPEPTGLRYCINSVALDFIAKVER